MPAASCTVGDCPFGFGGSIERQPAASKKFERSRSPHAGNERQRIASRRSDEDIDGTLRITGFDERRAERDGGRTDEALVEVADEIDVLLGGCEGKLEVAGSEHGEGAIGEVAGESLNVAGQPGDFDGAVKRVGSFGQLALQQHDLPEDRVGERDELALSAGAGNRRARSA